MSTCAESKTNWSRSWKNKEGLSSWMKTTNNSKTELQLCLLCPTSLITPVYWTINENWPPFTRKSWMSSIWTSLLRIHHQNVNKLNRSRSSRTSALLTFKVWLGTKSLPRSRGPLKRRTSIRTLSKTLTRRGTSTSPTRSLARPCFGPTQCTTQ